MPRNTYEEMTVSSTVLSLTAASYNPGSRRDGRSTKATITVETESIRISTSQGPTLATSGGGHLVLAGDSIELESLEEIQDFRCIAAGSDATIRVSYS